MTDTQQQPGIQNPVWIGGRLIIRGPTNPEIRPKRFEAKTRTANTGLRIDRPYLGAGLPNLRSRHELHLPWRTVQESDLLDHLDTLAALGQPFDVGLWKHVYDVFDGDGTTKTFYLQRRQLRPNVTPATDYPSYPTTATFYSATYGTTGATATPKTVVQKSTGSMSGTPDAGEVWVENTGHRTGGLWLSTVKCAEAPANVHDALVISYMPLYSMTIDEEDPRVYPAGIVEPRGWRLSEVG